MTSFRRLSMFALLLLAALLVAACGSDDDSSSDSKKDDGASEQSSIDTPAPLEQGGEFVVCTDVPYPPAESLDGDEYVGYEIDLMDEVADRLGTDATYEKTIFDSIIPALNAKKCDAVISSMNVTPEREKQVNFVKYMAIGQSLMVKAGNEGDISSLDDLAGKSVAVQVGTTLKDALDKKSKELDKPIDVQTFPDAGAAANALKTDKVDVFFADSPVVAEYVNKDKDAFAFAGEPIDPLPVGIAIRKGDDELLKAVQDAMDAMYADGTVEQILSDWKVQDFMLKDDTSADGDGDEEDGATS